MRASRETCAFTSLPMPCSRAFLPRAVAAFPPSQATYFLGGLCPESGGPTRNQRRQNHDGDGERDRRKRPEQSKAAEDRTNGRHRNTHPWATRDEPDAAENKHGKARQDRRKKHAVPQRPIREQQFQRAD